MKKFHQNYKITKKLKRLNNYLLLQFQIQYLYQQLFRDAKRLFVSLLLLLFLFFLNKSGIGPPSSIPRVLKTFNESVHRIHR